LLYDVSFSHNTLCHGQTDGRTDGQAIISCQYSITMRALPSDKAVEHFSSWKCVA